MRRPALLAFLAVVLLTVVVLTQALWRPLVGDGPWQVVFDGYGSVETSGDSATLAPQRTSSTDPERTHAALVVTREHYGDFVLTAELRTVEQFRPGTPNPWEVAWLLWHVTDPQHFYALVLKPNGWELSKQVPGRPGGQHFLMSNDTPRFPLGEWKRVTVTQRGGDISIDVDGRFLAHYVDPDPYPRGAVGLYVEDAQAVFRDISVSTEGV
ncbi:family 16 glycoside hydrolase [Geodermatophilus sp. SYSU D01062]